MPLGPCDPQLQQPFHFGDGGDLDNMVAPARTLTGAAVQAVGRTRAIFQCFSCQGKGQGRCVGHTEDSREAGGEGSGAELLW